MEATEEANNPIDNLIRAALGGNEGAVHQLHFGLTRKLVMVPIIRLDASFIGAGTAFFDPYVEGICSVLIQEIKGQSFLPLFTSRSLFADWSLSCDGQVEGVPLFAADVARIVPESSAMILNYGTPFAFRLNKEILMDTSNGVWLGSEAGIYRELSLVDPDLAAPHKAETQIVQAEVPPPPKGDLLSPKNPSAETEVTFIPRGHQIKARIGIDEINFRKSEPAKLSPEELREESYYRQRQGTFTKVLDVLRQYREKKN